MNILLIDDDVNLCKIIAHQLRKNGYQVETANSGTEGLQIFGNHAFDIVITDIQMPDISGIEVLTAIRRKDKNVIIIIITAYGSVENAVEACRLGADDYITKPSGQEQLLFIIEKAVTFRRMQQENVQLRHELTEKFQFENMVAKSAKMQDVLKMAVQVAESDATVLILGESGTGKELVARAIHYNSHRREKPLITVNCPSIPENLMESELFGHVKGAFSGAIKDRKGKFELADGGSIFLDEIAELREDLQAKLLRVLQEQEVERIGESRVIKIDVRVIAATNKNLQKMIMEGKFREDLYYRLSVIPITIPPLRERREDIPYLVEFFVRKFAKGRKLQLEPEFLTVLQKYDWPGNVRELENVIERAIVLTTSDRLTTETLPAGILNRQPTFEQARKSFPADELSLAAAERNAIHRALQQVNGNQSKAARLLKIPRHVLLYRMRKLGLR